MWARVWLQAARNGIYGDLLSAISAVEQGWQAHLHERGYAIVPDVVSSSEVMVLLVAMADLVSRRGRAGVRHVLNHPTVNVIANDRRLLGMAQEVLGPEAFPFRATLFDKSPESNWLVTWHQDTALPLREKMDIPGWGPWSVKDGTVYAHAPAFALNQALALRLHLDESNERNGPLRVLPATHTLGVLSDEEIARCADERTAVECFVGKGGIVAMKPLVVHASSKSAVEMPRRTLHIEYAANAGTAYPAQLVTV